MTLRQLAGDTLIYGTGYILGKVLSYLLITVYLTWKFDGEQAQYGLYTDLYFYVALILVVLTMRMETTYFRYGSDPALRDKAYGQSVLMLVCTALIWIALILLFHAPMAEALQYPGYEKHLIVLGLILALDVLVAVPFAALRLANRPVRYAVLKLTGIIINIVAVLFFLELLPFFADRNSAWAAAWYNHDDRLYYVFVANLIGSLTVFLAFLPGYLKMRWQWDGALALRMLKYTWPLIIVGIGGVINQSSYITFQKYILPHSLTENLSAGGVYAAATRIAILMSLFITAFNYAAEPFFFQHARATGARQMYADVARAFTIAASVLMLLILLYIDVIQLMIGASFREGLFVVPILLVAFLLLGLYYNFSIWYKLTDRTHYGALISGAGALITIVLNVVLIRKLEIVGSAWAALASYGFMAIACYLIGRKFFPVPYPVVRIALIIFGALVVYWISEQLRGVAGEELWALLAINTGLLIIYIGVAYRFEGHVIRAVFRRSQ